MRALHCLVLLALAVPAAARSPIPAPPPQNAGGAVSAVKPVDELTRLRGEWDATRAAAQEKGDAAQLAATRADMARRARELMSADPRSDLAVRTRIWFVASQLDPAANAELLDELMTKDLASPSLALLADVLGPGSFDKAPEMLKTLLEKGADDTVRGRALRTIADHQRRDLERVREAEQNPDEAAKAFAGESMNRAAELRKIGAAELEKRYVATLTRITKEFADVPDARGRPLGARAEGTIFELENLGIGKLAPVIEAEDIFGATFKTSDYRGKVVVLDFWGHW